MPGRTDYSSADHTRLWEHFNDIGATINESCYADYQRAAAQSIPTSVATTVLWDTTFDGADGVGLSFAAGVFTILKAGTWLVNARISYLAAGGPGTRQARLYKNGGLLHNASAVGSTGGTSSVTLCETLRFVAGDAFDVRAYQTSGAAATLDTGARATKIQLEWLKP